MISPEASAPQRQPRSMWQFSSREVLVMLVAAAVSTWAAMVVVVLMRQPILGGDFMVFYTFGHLAWRGQWAMQYDWRALHDLQVSVVPATAAYFYPPSYPPLVPILYAPIAGLSFPVAFAVWMIGSGAVYAAMMALAARGCPKWPRGHFVLAALVFPPFIAHQVLGQSTIWAFIGFVGGWRALIAGRPKLAGLILSLVAIKPHLGMALAVVLLATGSWQTVIGIIIGMAVQAVITVMICGTNAVQAYVETTIAVLRNPGLIEPIDARHTHTLRMTLERVVSPAAATAVWFALFVIVSWLAVSIWRRHENWIARMSGILLATLLVSPHLQTYDAILLAPAAFWLLGNVAPQHRARIVVGVCVLSIAFLLPGARIAGTPISIPLMLWLLYECRGDVFVSGGPQVQTA